MTSILIHINTFKGLRRILFDDSNIVAYDFSSVQFFARHAVQKTRSPKWSKKKISKEQELVQGQVEINILVSCRVSARAKLSLLEGAVIKLQNLE